VIRVTCEQPSKRARRFAIEVIDSGWYLARNQAKLFERLRRQTGSTTRKYGGNGPRPGDLSTVVTLMGGKWRAKRTHQGTRFWLNVPFDRQNDISRNGDPVHVT